MTEHELAAGAAASAPRRGTFLPAASPVAPSSVAEAGDLIMPIYAALVVHDGATRASGALPSAAALTFDIAAEGVAATRLRRAGQIATAGMAAAVIAVVAAAFAPVPNSATTAYDASAQADTIDQPYPSSTSKPLAAEGGRIKVDLHKPDDKDAPADVPSFFGIPLPDVPFIQDLIGGGTPPANGPRGSGGGSQAEAPGGLPTSDPRADVPTGSAGEPIIPGVPNSPWTPGASGPSSPSNPGTSNPGTSNPGTSNPGTSNPGTSNPGTSNPGTSNPGTSNPGTSNPGGGETTNPGGGETTNPGGGETTNPPTEPSNPPTEPSNPPTEPSNPPTEPSNPPTEPSNPPVEPSNPPTEPSNPPVEPSNPPVEPSNPPVEPSNPPVEPSNPPVEPSNPPVEPSNPPTEPTEPPAPIAPSVSQYQSPTKVLGVDVLGIKVQVATRYYLAVSGEPGATVTVSGGLLGLQSQRITLNGSGQGSLTMDVLLGLGTPRFTVH